ncbi:hypothetical protein CH063_13511, partial [Colletotrichum higginsianum]
RTAAKLVQVSGVVAPLTGFRSYTAGKSLCVCNGKAADGSTTSAVVAVRPCGIQRHGRRVTLLCHLIARSRETNELQRRSKLVKRLTGIQDQGKTL